MTKGTLIGQAPTATSVAVLACLATDEQPDPGSYEISIADHDRVIPVDSWEVLEPLTWNLRREWDQRFGRRPIPVTMAKLRIDGLDPATTYTLRLVEIAGGRSVSRAEVRTLPESSAGTANVVFGSCHALQHTDQARRQSTEFLTGAYEKLTEQSGPADANVWLGDQVYADDHIARNLVATDPHRAILDSYAKTWGLGEGKPSGLASMMQQAANWYLPDDHEFWNDYPRASVTLPFHTAKRLAHHLYRYARGIGDMPHPHDQGPWGRTAGAAYLAFQSPDQRPFGSFGYNANPEMLAQFDVAGVKIGLLDTRWRRTMSKARNPNAGFMTPEALQQLERLLDNDGPVVIGLARPLIGQTSHRGWFTEEWESGPENFRRQYRQLWSLLGKRSAAGKPTIIIAGDVHEHSAKLTADGTIAEFVCPPLSLLPSLRPASQADQSSRFSGIMDIKGRVVRRFWNTESTSLTHVDPAGVDGPDGVHAHAEGTPLIVKDEGVWEGLAMLRIDNEGDGPLEVSCHFELSDITTAADKPQSVTLRWDGDRWQQL